MTRQEAEDLILRSEERLCLRFYRRRDGTILTENCPVGLQAIKARFTRTRTHILAAIFAFLSYLGLLRACESVDRQLNTVRLSNVFAHPTMGAMAPPPTVSESEIRERAISKVIPIHHSTGSTLSGGGDVVVKVLIGGNGTVDFAWCDGPETQLNELAKEAARRWEFEPFLDQGRPTAVQSTLTFHFKD
jgi:hypothetical protein